MQNNVVSLSGGKDSTAMLHMMLERGEPVHSVVFFDTGWEFPEMREHIDLVERKTGLKVVKLSPKKPFEYWMFERVKEKGDIGAKGYGWPNTSRWCTELKTRDIDKYKRKIANAVDCIGIAADEIHRVKASKRYPLIEYGVTEAQALEYCLNLGYTWGGLYEIFDRVSCWCCPQKSLPELRNLRNKFPKLWGKLIEMEAKIPQHSAPFKSGVTVAQLEERFAREERYPVDMPARVVRRMMKQKQGNFFEVAPC